MADYVSILNKAISGLGENNADNRQVIYQKARGAIDRKLRSMDPPPAEEAIAAQMAQLEEAINQVEGEQQLTAMEQPVDEVAPLEPPVEASAAPEPPRTPVSAPAPAPAPETPVAPAMDEQASVTGNAPLPQASPAPQSSAGSVPAPNPPTGFVDDVILIDGIGEKTRAALEGEGVTSISQIAAMSDDQLAMITENIGSPGFEKTQEWKKQAGEMLGGALPRSKTDQDRLSKLKEEQTAASPEPVNPDPAAPMPDPAPQTGEAVPQPEPVTPPVASTPPAAPVAATPAPTMPAAPPEAAPSSTDPASSVPPVAQAPKGEAKAETPTVVDQAAPQPPEQGATEGDEQKAFADAIAELTRGHSQPPEQGVAAPASTNPVQQPQVGTTSGAEMTLGAEPAVTADAGAPPSVGQIEGDPFAEGSRAGEPLSSDFGRGGVVPKPKRSLGKTLGCAGLLALLGGVAYGGWLYRDQVRDISSEALTTVQELFAGSPVSSGPETDDAPSTDTSGEGDAKDDARLGSDADAGAGGTDESLQGTNDSTSGDGAGDATQGDAPRNILADPVEQPEATVEVEGESDPLAGEQTIDESAGEQDAGTDGAGEAQTASGEEAEADTSTAQQETPTVEPAIAAGESAFLYEEAIGATGANRDEGGVIWSLAQEAPEAGAPPEAVIKGLFEVPARGLKMNISIKRNVDPGLPASHIIELLFTAPPDFSGGNIDNVSRFVLKATEQARGESLVGVPARIDAGFFLIALNNLEQAQQTNTRLLESGEWIDIPVAYVTGRRGLITLAKGETGGKVFADALADWRNR